MDCGYDRHSEYDCSSICLWTGKTICHAELEGDKVIYLLNDRFGGVYRAKPVLFPLKLYLMSLSGFPSLSSVQPYRTSVFFRTLFSLFTWLKYLYFLKGVFSDSQTRSSFPIIGSNNTLYFFHSISRICNHVFNICLTCWLKLNEGRNFSCHCFFLISDLAPNA